MGEFGEPGKNLCSLFGGGTIVAITITITITIAIVIGLSWHGPVSSHA